MHKKFEGDDSPFNLYAAQKVLSSKLGAIKTIRFILKGKWVQFPVRWFYVADYKNGKGVAGILCGNCKFPCLTCLCTTRETYAEIDLSVVFDIRPEGPNEEWSQPRPPLFPFIPLNHFINPPLHITLGPGADLFDYLFEIISSIDAELSNVEQIYETLKENPKWQKDLRKRFEEIESLKEELTDLNESSALYDKIFSGEKQRGRVKQCSLKQNCVANLIRKSIPFVNSLSCSSCSQNYHECCMNDVTKTCPLCTSYHPSLEDGKRRLLAEHVALKQQISETLTKLKDMELQFKKDTQKLESGVLTKKLEAVLEKYGGSRRAYFQAYTGAHLIQMGNNIQKICDELPEEIATNEKCIIVFGAIKLFFEVRKLMSKNFMDEAQIMALEEKIQEFADYMKIHLGFMKPKQKGHLLLKHVPAFARMFGTVSFFTDEAIEAYNALFNNQDDRLKMKLSPKKLVKFMEWNVELNYLYDTVHCDKE
uniref:Uncharacterized protein n=1 Tax=Panagrolaimus superbus TaxID=310955 RepID=A0A914Z1V6_9BILA